MGRGAFQKTSFNAGELSPLLDGRSDLEKYPQGCSLLENFVTTVQGPIYHRPGTQFVDDLGATKPVLVPFVYNRDQAYVLSIGSVIRVYADRGIVEASPGVPYTFGAGVWLAPPRRADGRSRLSYTQSGDVLFVCDADGGLPLMAIKRLGALSWTVEPYELAIPPLGELNIKYWQIYKQRVIDGAAFPALPDGQWYLWHGDYSPRTNTFESPFVRGKVAIDLSYTSPLSFTGAEVIKWTPGMSVTARDVVECNGRYYHASASGTLGSEPLTHENLDGPSSSIMLYIGNGTICFDIISSGIAAPVAGSPYFLAIITLSPAPQNEYRGPDLFCDADAWWNNGLMGRAIAFAQVIDWKVNPADNYIVAGVVPDNVAIFRDRLVMSANRSVWTSVAGDLPNFSRMDGSGQVVADMGMALDLLAGDLSPVSWIASSDRLVLGSPGGERAIGEQNISNAFGPTNVKVDVTSATGSVDVGPALVGRDILMLDRTGRRLIRTALTQDGQGFQNLSALADHIGLASPFVAMAWREVPTPILFLVSAAGELVGCTFEASQDVASWHRHKVGGLVRDVVAIPSLDGTRDDLWLLVERTILGSQRFYLEVMPDDYRMGLQVEDARYLDSSISYDGAPANTFSGLGHLEGESVQAVGDGIVYTGLTVNLGEVTLPGDPVSKVSIGKYTPARVRTMRLHLGADDGVNMGKTGRLTKVTARLVDTVNLRAGRKFDEMVRLDFRNGSQNMDAAVPSQSEERSWSPVGGYSSDGYLCLEQDQPLPATIVALGLEFTVD